MKFLCKALVIRCLQAILFPNLFHQIPKYDENRVFAKKRGQNSFAKHLLQDVYKLFYSPIYSTMKWSFRHILAFATFIAGISM